MPITTPKRHPAFKPIGALRAGPFASGKKGLMAGLNLTAMVDMFTVIVIFLLQSFSASGELMFMQPGLKLPPAKMTQLLEERGPVLTLFKNQVLLEGQEIAKTDALDDADPGIPTLSEKLTGVREREEKLAEQRGQPRDPTKPFDGYLVIQADSSTDFKFVRKAVFSANEAGWAHLQFVVMGEGKGPEEGEGEEGEAKAEG